VLAPDASPPALHPMWITCQRLKRCWHACMRAHPRTGGVFIIPGSYLKIVLCQLVAKAWWQSNCILQTASPKNACYFLLYEESSCGPRWIKVPFTPRTVQDKNVHTHTHTSRRV